MRRACLPLEPRGRARELGDRDRSIGFCELRPRPVKPNLARCICEAPCCCLRRQRGHRCTVVFTGTTASVYCSAQRTHATCAIKRMLCGCYADARVERRRNDQRRRDQDCECACTGEPKERNKGGGGQPGGGAADSVSGGRAHERPRLLTYSSYGAQCSVNAHACACISLCAYMHYSTNRRGVPCCVCGWAATCSTGRRLTTRWCLFVGARRQCYLTPIGEQSCREDAAYLRACGRVRPGTRTLKRWSFSGLNESSSR